MDQGQATEELERYAKYTSQDSCLHQRASKVATDRELKVLEFIVDEISCMCPLCPHSDAGKQC